jgi:uncharacterized membrane-anchored protein
MKICATTLGETAGDLLSMTLKVGYAVSTLILMALFAFSVLAQVRSRRFHPALYWCVILTTSTAGTTMSDFLDRSLKLGYALGSAILASILIVVLAAWRRSGQTMSVSEIRSRPAEVFYWLAILISNTLGTAAGDFLADDSGLGFLGGAALIAGLIGVVALLAFLTRANRVVLFWIAFVLTRPFGATFGDLLTKPREQGGLDFGTIGSSIVLAGVLVAMIAWTSRKRRGFSEGGVDGATDTSRA